MYYLLVFLFWVRKYFEIKNIPPSASHPLKEVTETELTPFLRDAKWHQTVLSQFLIQPCNSILMLEYLSLYCHTGIVNKHWKSPKQSLQHACHYRPHWYQSAEELLLFMWYLCIRHIAQLMKWGYTKSWASRARNEKLLQTNNLFRRYHW